MTSSCKIFALISVSAALSGCSMAAEQAGFLMPDGRPAAFVSLAGNGTTPPVVAVITPRASPYNVQVVSTTPVVQSVFQGAVAGAAIGGGLAAQGALIRPDRISSTSSASGQGGNATGGSATGGIGLGGSACAGTC